MFIAAVCDLFLRKQNAFPGFSDNNKRNIPYQLIKIIIQSEFLNLKSHYSTFVITIFCIVFFEAVAGTLGLDDVRFKQLSIKNVRTSSEIRLSFNYNLSE